MTTTNKETGFLVNRPQWLRLSLISIFLVAGLLRLYNLDAPGLLIDRDFTSAILARDFYFQEIDTIESWRKEMAHAVRQTQPVLEPPVTEWIVSRIYLMAGDEQLALARLLTSAFWLLGGIFIYRITKKLVSIEGALFATAYYLFLPLSVLLSRSFQPEALMMLMFLASLFYIIRYFEHSGFSRLLFAGVLTGMTLLYRPIVLFMLLGAFIGLAVYHAAPRRQIFKREYFLFCGISFLPCMIYYGYGTFVAGFLHHQIEMSFRPYLLMEWVFWRDWFELAVTAVGPASLAMALLAFPLAQNLRIKYLSFGLGAGYIFFGLVFTMHIHTHGYYHAQLIPFIAILLGVMSHTLFKHLKSIQFRWYTWVPVTTAILFLAFGINFREIQDRLGSRIFETEKTAAKIGELVKHSSRTVWISSYYGIPLQYYGQLTGSFWPRGSKYWLYQRPDDRYLNIEERLSALRFQPEYFVVTHFREFNTNHADVKEYLAVNCTPVKLTNHYLVYQFPYD